MPQSTKTPKGFGRRACMVATASLLSASACVDPGTGRSDQLEPDANTRYHVQDRLGSAALVLDNDGAVVARSAHRPYGERWVDWHADGERGPTYRFTDKEEDPLSEGIYIGARHYLPALGRWTSPDPMLLHAVPDASPEHAIQANPYGYAAGNPVDLVDPDGHAVQAVALAIAGGAAIGAASEIAVQLMNGEDINLKKVGTAAAVGGATAPLAAKGAIVRIGVTLGMNVGKSAFDAKVIDGNDVDWTDAAVGGLTSCVRLGKATGKAAEKFGNGLVENVVKSKFSRTVSEAIKSAPTHVAPKAMTMDFDDPMPSSQSGPEYTIPDAR